MDKTQQEMRKIQEVIEKGQNFLVIAHKNVDGDAYGSSMSLYFYLQNLGKTVEVVNEFPITPLFYFLDIHTIITKEIVGKKFDAIFVCDCGELSLVGKYPETYPEIFENTPIVNIDHHPGNKMFGICNIVDMEASSACELMSDFMEGIGANIDPEIATLLLFGIIRDTNCFKNSIRPRTFEVTSKLLALWADYEKVIFYSYKSEKINYLQLYGHALENLISLKWGTIVGCYIPQETFMRYNIRENELGPQFINEILSSLDGADFAFLIKETESGDRKLSFRSRRNGFDVSRVAAVFGWGGHIQSGGAYTNKSLEEILKTIENADARMQ